MSGGVFRRAAWQRVNECYAWKGYAERLMPLSLVYGFWRYVTELERGDRWPMLCGTACAGCLQLSALCQ